MSSDIKPYHERFRQAIREIMNQNGKSTIKEVAPITGISYMVLYKIMSSSYKPNIEHLQKLQRLGISPGWIISGKGDMNEKEEASMQKLIKEVREIRDVLGLIK